MKIENIKVENFKSIKSLRLENVAPITGIWEKNGMGKSNILLSLLLLKNEKEFSKFISRSKKIDVCYKHDTKLSVSVRVDFKINSTLHIPIIAKYIENEIVVNIEMEKIEKNKKIKILNDARNSIRYYPVNREITSINSDIGKICGDNLLGTQTNIHSTIYRKLNNLYRDDRRKLESFNNWLSKFGYGDLNVKEERTGILTSYFKDNILNHDFLLVEAGSGSRNLFILLYDVFFSNDNIFLIEEPEMSLHPGAQSELIDFFIKMSKENGHQFIFTSHSPYFLSRISRHIKKNSEDKNLFLVLHTKKTKDGTKIEKREVEKIEEFWKETMPELFER